MPIKLAPHIAGRIAPHIALLAAGLLLAGSTYAQQSPQLDPDASGTYYMIAFPDTVGNVLDSRYPNHRVKDEMTLWMFSPVSNKATITTGGGGTTVLTLDAGSFTTYTAPAFSPVTTYNQISRNTLKVATESPIVLYCYFANSQELEAWTPIPAAQWGTSYRVASLPGDRVEDIGLAGETIVPTTHKLAPAEVLVVAAFDNTHVSLHPRGGITLQGNPPLNVTLNERDAFQIASLVDTTDDALQEDIAGMEISADKPIGVISGDPRSQTAADDRIGGPGFIGNAYKGMQMEWLAPVEQYGRHFVHTPTWDGYRSGTGAAFERRHEFVRVYNPANAQMNGSYRMTGDAASRSFTIAAGSSRILELASDAWGEIQTDLPAQVMMHSSSAISPVQTSPCFRGLLCMSYSGLAGYMVSETPREQWMSFAPYYVPANPGTMQHYINVVTDTASAPNIVQENGATFPFTRRIPGTDLIWGSMAVLPGTSHWLQGSNGARFAGTVYGIMKGSEDYRPGAARKKDDGSQMAGAGAHDPTAQHPCEYEEYNALSYGYPLAPRRNVVNGPSSVANSAPEAAGFALDAVRDGENVRVHFALPPGAHGALVVHNSLGQQVAMLVAGVNEGGDRSVVWNTSGIPSGTYFITLSASSGSRTVPVVVTR